MKYILKTALAAAAIAVCLFILPGTAQAATEDDLTYEISNNQVTITDCDTAATGTLEIPAAIEGYPVTAIGPSAFLNCSALTDIIIPETVTDIGEKAFQFCHGISTITIPESISLIRPYTFYGCNGLTTITIPGNVKSIGNFAFYSCESLSSVIFCEGVQSIYSYTFYYCTALKWVVIPESLTLINTQAFYKGESLEHVLYAGSQVQWANITIGSINSDLTRIAEIHYNTYWTQGCACSGWFCPECFRIIAVQQELGGSHSYYQGRCTVCGMSQYPYGGFVSSGYTGYNDLASAVASSEWVKLFRDTDTTLTLTDDLYIDLNGHDLTGTITTGTYSVYGMDSSTDRYTCDAMGHFSCIDEDGAQIQPVTHFRTNDSRLPKRYMAIKDDFGYSFHRFYLGLNYKSLRPSTVSVGYKGTLYGDEMVAANLKNFGFTLQLAGNDPVNAALDGSKFVSGKIYNLRLDNYDVNTYGETMLYSSMFITLLDGTVIQTSATQTTMRMLVEELNVAYEDLTADELAGLQAMIEKFPIIKTWDIYNLV